MTTNRKPRQTIQSYIARNPEGLLARRASKVQRERTVAERALIEEAKELVMGDLDCDEPTAYSQLRTLAMHTRQTINRVCVLVLGRA